MRHVYVEMKGVIPGPVLEALRAEFGHKLLVRCMAIEEMRDVRDAPQFKPEPWALEPSEALWFFRNRNGLTQGELGMRLGGIAHQNISAMEQGVRPIGRAMARRFA